MSVFIVTFDLFIVENSTRPNQFPIINTRSGIVSVVNFGQESGTQVITVQPNPTPADGKLISVSEFIVLLIVLIGQSVCIHER